MPFPTAAAEPTGPVLSPLERNAFRELSRKLTQRLTAGGLAHEDKDGTSVDDASQNDASEKLNRRKPTLPSSARILDTATDGVILLDRKGCMLSANRSAQALFGYDPHELIGRAFSKLFAAGKRGGGPPLSRRRHPRRHHKPAQ